MMALWGNLHICPHLDSSELPCHTSGELLSISCLNIWEKTQEPLTDMAYLLVRTGDTSEAQSYGLSLVWISPHQVRDRMTEFVFFASKEIRWGWDMMALWGNLHICPHLNSLELPCHTSGELLSISHLKVWGNTQEPRTDMAYLLVHTGDTSEAQSYGLSLVWISPHQVRASTMGEAIGTLSIYISSGPDWPTLLHNYTRAPAIHPSQGQPFRCPAPGKGRREPLWVD